MKIIFIRIIVGMFLLLTVLPVISCSRDKAAKKPASSPERAKSFEEYKKGVEESKKVVVARVNGVDLSLKELIDIMNQVAPRYIKDDAPNSPETDEKIKKEALDALVFRELAFQEAIKRGMRVKPEDVNAAMTKLKTKFGSESAYKEYLVKSGLVETSLRKQIERDQLIEMITTKEIFLKAKVDEKLVRDTYNKEKSSFVVPESFVIEDVFIQTLKENDVSAMNKAKETLSLLIKNKNDMSKLALDKNLVVRSGGVTEQEYPNIFKAAANMKTGELSSVIRESDGLHIVKLLQKEPARQMGFEEARVEIEHKLMLPVINKKKQLWENELKKNARIKIMDTQDVMPAPDNLWRY